MKKSFFNLKILTNSSFTMVEIFLVIAILATIGAAFYNSLSNGIKIWDRAYKHSSEEDVAIFLEKISFDLKNSVPYSLIRFDGYSHSISFAAIVKTPADAEKDISTLEYINEVGRVEYYFDKIKKRLLRRQANYSQALNKEFAPSRVLVDKVKSLQFRYLYKTEEGFSLTDRGDGIIPSVVVVKIEFGEGKPNYMERFINVPIGS